MPSRWTVNSQQARSLWGLSRDSLTCGGESLGWCDALMHVLPSYQRAGMCQEGRILGFNNAKLELPDRPGLTLSHEALPFLQETFFTNKKSFSANERFSGERYSARYLSPLGRKNTIILDV